MFQSVLHVFHSHCYIRKYEKYIFRLMHCLEFRWVKKSLAHFSGRTRCYLVPSPIQGLFKGFCLNSRCFQYCTNPGVFNTKPTLEFSILYKPWIFQYCTNHGDFNSVPTLEFSIPTLEFSILYLWSESWSVVSPSREIRYHFLLLAQSVEPIIHVLKSRQHMIDGKTGVELHKCGHSKGICRL